MMFNTDKLKAKIAGFADAALIFSEENRKYFTEFSASDGVLLVSARGTLFFTDSRYTEAAARCMGEEYVRDSGNLFETLRNIFAANDMFRIAIENDRMTVAELERLEANLPDTDIIANHFLANAIAEIRSEKADSEVEKVKKAQKIADEAFLHMLDFIKPGLTEKEIQLELDFYMLSHGAEALSFDTIAVSGKNSSMPHGVASYKKVEKGDFITMDFGAVYEGYHSDMTRTVILGSPTEKQKLIYNTVAEAQTAALSSLHAGLPCADADKAARDVIKNAGFGEFFGHGTGHGVGVEIHENPFVSPRSKQILRAGNIVTAEPGIYLPGEFGVRIEDMALITETGHINLTGSPKELISL